MQSMKSLIQVGKSDGEKLLIIDHVLVSKITPLHTDGAYAVGEIIVPPRSSPPLHKHAAQESFYVVSGAFSFSTVTDGKLESFDVNTGEYVHVPSYVPHTFANVGQTNGVLIGWLAPPQMAEFFEKIGRRYDGRPLKAARPSLWSLLKIGRYAKKFGISFVRKPKA